VFVVECRKGSKGWTVKQRYSAFDDLRRTVAREVGTFQNPFPGKALLGGKLNAAQTEKRREQLEAWLQELFDMQHAVVQRTLTEFLDEPSTTTSSTTTSTTTTSTTSTTTTTKQEAFEEAPPAGPVEEPSTPKEATWDESFMMSDPLAMLAPEEEKSEASNVKPKEEDIIPLTTTTSKVPPPAETEKEEHFFTETPSFLLGGTTKKKDAPTYDRTGEGIRDAIKDGAVDAVKAILDADPALAAYTDRQMSMLHLACILDNADVALALVAKGAPTNVKDQNNETPLDLAPPSLKDKILQAANRQREKKHNTPTN